MLSKDELYNLRRSYKKSRLKITSTPNNPFELFDLWFTNALNVKMLEPNAMVLSTVSREGKPSSRVLLLKKFDESGFSFFTNFNSKKGTDISDNPNGSLLFYWDKLERQIRIEGQIEKISEEESEEYFKTRPYTSRIGAWASKQSQPLDNRRTLIGDAAKLMLRHPVHVPLPPFWGGFKLVADEFEFWQGRDSRLHDRIKYVKENNEWLKFRLYP